MENIPLSAIFSGSSVIVSFIGLYFVASIWAKWKYIDKDVLKARVFLDKKFLAKNWIYVFLAGAALTVHQMIDFLMSLNYITGGWLREFSELFEFMTLLFFVILAYEWYKIIYLKNKTFTITAL